jgi:hypothetical protein
MKRVTYGYHEAMLGSSVMFVLSFVARLLEIRGECRKALMSNSISFI